MATKALKAKNSTTLLSIVTVDVLVVFAVTSWSALVQGSDWTTLTTLRCALTSCVPVVILLLNSLIPSKVKAVIVFWRITDALPGHRAFSKLALNDSRIDLDRLRNHIGAFPEDPHEQNTVWYRLFKKVEKEASIDYSHQQFLLLRDLASLSFLLLWIAPIGWMSEVLNPNQSGATAAVFSIQYLLAALGAATQGKGLVTSVLALHSVKRRV